MTTLKKFTYFIGIDVSRNELDFAVMQGNSFLFHREIKNEDTEIKTLLSEIKTLPKFTRSRAVFGLEYTGVYGSHLLNALKRFKSNIVQENALFIRNSLGNIRGKHDKIDSIRIAQYLYKNKEHLRLWQPKRMVLQQLAYLSVIRNRLISFEKTLTSRFKEDGDFMNKKILMNSKQLCNDTLQSLASDLKTVNDKISELIKNDNNLDRLHNLIISVPCVGTVTAVQIMITTNEFIDISDPKKFACYAGVVPFKNDSGQVERRGKISPMANKKIKALLQICAIGAIQHVPDLKAYYIKKTTLEGKPKMMVLNAIRNKLVLRIFACVNQNRIYQTT